MVSIIVVLEHPDEPVLLLVHAAPSDPDVPGDPGPVTACGIDTTGMVVAPWGRARHALVSAGSAEQGVPALRPRGAIQRVARRYCSAGAPTYAASSRRGWAVPAA